MEDPNQQTTFNPFQPVEQPNPTPTQQPFAQPVRLAKSSRINKKIGIIIAAVVLIVGMVGGAFYLKIQADGAAIQYAKDVDAHFEEVFAEQDNLRRTETVKDTAVLDKVFLGSVLSSDYKQVSTETKDKYLAIMKEGAEYAKMRVEYGGLIKEIISDIQKVLSSTDTKMNVEAGDKVDFKGMEQTLVAMLEKADRLDVIAKKVETTEAFKAYSSRSALISSLHEWSAAQRGVVSVYLQWIEDITDMAQGILKDFANTMSGGSPSEIKKIDDNAFMAQSQKYIDDYKVASNRAVDALEAMVGELEKDPALQTMITKRDELNNKTTAFRAELKKIIE